MRVGSQLIFESSSKINFPQRQNSSIYSRRKKSHPIHPRTEHCIRVLSARNISNMKFASTSILIFFCLAVSTALPRVKLPLNEKSIGSVASNPSATDLTPISTKATWKANMPNLARRESWEDVVSLYPLSRLYAHLEGFLNEKLTTQTKQAVEVHNL